MLKHATAATALGAAHELAAARGEFSRGRIAKAARGGDPGGRGATRLRVVAPSRVERDTHGAQRLGQRAVHGVQDGTGPAPRPCGTGESVCDLGAMEDGSAARRPPNGVDAGTELVRGTSEQPVGRRLMPPERQTPGLPAVEPKQRRTPRGEFEHRLVHGHVAGAVRHGVGEYDERGFPEPGTRAPRGHNSRASPGSRITTSAVSPTASTKRAGSTSINSQVP